MALPAAALIGAGLGSNLLGSILGTRSERSRKKKLRQRLLAENAPLEALLGQRQFAPTQSEGALMQAVTQRTIGDLQQRGVLNSSIAAPAVASAVAPFENQRQQRTQGLLERVVAARQAILEGTELPGYGAAFGEAFGEAGDLLALQGGRGLFGGDEDGGRSSAGGLATLEPPGFDDSLFDESLGLSGAEEPSEFSELDAIVRGGRKRKRRYR